LASLTILQLPLTAPQRITCAVDVAKIGSRNR
jgi:hypothetical protein